MKYLQYNVSPIQIKWGMEIARDKIIEFLNEICVPIESKEQLLAVAMVSTNYDKNIS